MPLVLDRAGAASKQRSFHFHYDLSIVFAVAWISDCLRARGKIVRVIAVMHQRRNPRILAAIINNRAQNLYSRYARAMGRHHGQS